MPARRRANRIISTVPPTGSSAQTDGYGVVASKAGHRAQDQRQPQQPQPAMVPLTAPASASAQSAPAISSQARVGSR